jgi:hypothetical protein
MSASMLVGVAREYEVGWVEMTPVGRRPGPAQKQINDTPASRAEFVSSAIRRF